MSAPSLDLRRRKRRDIRPSRTGHGRVRRGAMGAGFRKLRSYPLPQGSELFLLPDRLPVGITRSGDFEVLEYDPQNPGKRVCAVAAFMAPAHTATFSAAYQTLPNAPNLPLFAYTAAGFGRDGFMAGGLRIDPLPRQDASRFPSPQRLASASRRLLRIYKNNRLWQHLGTCALTYCCPAAQNLMLGRWEAPLPTSPACNAACLGCLNSQPEGRFPCTQDRIKFAPTPAEVAEVANHHFAKATDPLVSFGQGCEGEPLLQDDLLTESIHLIRKKHPFEHHKRQHQRQPAPCGGRSDAGGAHIHPGIREQPFAGKASSLLPAPRTGLWPTP